MKRRADPKVITSFIGLFGSVITAIIGFLAVVVQIYLSSQIGSPANPTPTPVPQSVPTQIAALQSDIATLRQELDSLSQAIQTNPNSSPDVLALQSDVKSIDSRLSVIEQAVLDNPARALELTLLSRDMENLTETYQADLDTTRKEIERVYSFNQWFLGAVITLSLAVVSLALSNFLKKPEKPKAEKDKESEARAKSEE